LCANGPICVQEGKEREKGVVCVCVLEFCLREGREGWSRVGEKEIAAVEEMEKMFGPAYTGDPGVPHSDKGAFSSIFWGSVLFSAYSIVCPYYWEQCNNTFK
jgi:hypothetical protein